MSAAAKSTSGKILHNSFWYGLEQVVEAIVFFGTSIAVARYLGPKKLGYFSYINLFVTIVTRTSGTGVASATRKYMSEFLATDQPGKARSVYYILYRYQLLAATTIAAIGVSGIVLFGQSGFRKMSVILIISIIPGIMSWVPAHANQAFEDVSKNTLSALCYIATYATVIVLSIMFHWDLNGIAMALLIGRTVEVLLRTFPLHRRLRSLPQTPLDHETISRIRRFCLQSVGIQLLMSVVWDRSEIVFLRHFSRLSQIAFYSVSYGLCNNLLLIPRTFGAATGITLMLDTSRDANRADNIIRNASRFLLFVVIPVHLGFAAIAGEAVRVTYGHRYELAIPVLIIASILAIPRAFQELAETLIRTADKQKELLIWYSVTGVVNIALDYFFIVVRHKGAVGAAWGNGLSQTFGVMVIWWRARKLYKFHFPWTYAVRLGLAGSAMAGLAWFVGTHLPPVLGLALAVVAAVPTYLLLVRLFRGLTPEDRARLESIGARLPGGARRVYNAVVAMATSAPAESAL